MRLAVTIARQGTKWSVLAGPEVELGEHNAAFKKIKLAEGTIDKAFYNEVRILGNGIDRRAKFLSADEKKANEKSRAEQQAIFEKAEAERKEASAKGISVEELRKQAKKPAATPETHESSQKKGKKTHEA